MPSSPLAPGSCTLATFSRNSCRCGVTMMSSMASGSIFFLRFGLRVALHSFSLLQGLINRAHHVKSLLRNIVVLAFHNFLEAPNRVFDLHVFPFQPGKLRSYEHRLRKEFFDFAGARYGALIVVGKFFNTENGDDVLQILVALQNGFHAASHRIMFGAHDARIENARKTG